MRSLRHYYLVIQTEVFELPVPGLGVHLHEELEGDLGQVHLLAAHLPVKDNLERVLARAVPAAVRGLPGHCGHCLGVQLHRPHGLAQGEGGRTRTGFG